MRLHLGEDAFVIFRIDDDGHPVVIFGRRANPRRTADIDALNRLLEGGRFRNRRFERIKIADEEVDGLDAMRAHRFAMVRSIAQRQQSAMDSGVQRLAEVAFEVNERTENIGARRLHTVMERLLESVSFDAADRNGTRLLVNREYVEGNLGELVRDQDLSRYIL